MMYYSWESPLGTLVIMPQNDNSGRWWLGLALPTGAYKRLGSYPSAVAAVAHLRAHRTGWDEWDARPTDASATPDIASWNQWPVV
jgi:hypothetical protein